MAWVDGVPLREQCLQLKEKYNSRKKGAELLASLMRAEDASPAVAESRVQQSVQKRT